MTRRLLIGASIGLVAGLLAAAAARLPLLQGFEDQTYDRRLRAAARPVGANSDIVLIYINESSLRGLEPLLGRWPWPRLVHSGVIDFLARAGARVVAYDVLFIEPDRVESFKIGGRSMSGQQSDATLVDSVKRAGNVVLLADVTFEGLADESTTDSKVGAERPQLPGPAYAPGAGFETRPSLKLPFSELAAAAMAIGHNFAVKESRDAVRRMAPFIENHGVAVPSLGLAAALAAERVPVSDVRLEHGDTLRIGSRQMPLVVASRPVLSRRALLNFRKPTRSAGGATSTYPVFSFFDVLLSEEQLSSGQKPAIDPSVFRDKIVFIGTTAAGLYDVYTSPFGDAGMPGLQLHAALADDVLSSRFMRRATSSADAGVTVGAALLAGVVAAALPVIWATAAVIALAAALVFGLTRAIGTGLWMALVAPIAGVGLALFGGVAWQYFVEGREKRQVKRLFGRYVSRSVFDQLMADPSLARLGGERREMTVLFSDIRGFTTASEAGTPEDVVAQLNEYFTAMVDVLFRHGGTLDKFVGDMVMGLFGAPVADSQHADHAVATALEMSSALDALNARWKAAGRPALDIGIGINSGEMIAGNIGSDTIMSYTVIGDAVNLGSRLESLNKEYGTRILISQATKDRLTRPVPTRLIGEAHVKGRAQSVVVYEVLRS